MRVHIREEAEAEFSVKLKQLINRGISLSFGSQFSKSPDYDILVCGVPDRELIEASPNLKRLIIPWAGLPKRTSELMRAYPRIDIHNIHHNKVAVAEMAIALMLTSAKQIIPAHNSLARNDWAIRYDDNPGILQLSGKRGLILGYGAIGKEIADRLTAFGVKVAAVSRRGGEDTDIPTYPLAELNNLLPSADLLFLSLPLTDATRELIGAKQLSLLPERAIIINISRGAIINEAALFDSLKKGKLRAGLDVWYHYPETTASQSETEPSQYRFGDLPNVILTPHIAGHSDQSEPLRAIEIARLLNLASEGKELPNRVDLKNGY